MGERQTPDSDGRSQDVMDEGERRTLVAELADELERRGAVAGSLLLDVMRAQVELRNLSRVLLRIEEAVIRDAHRDAQDHLGES